MSGNICGVEFKSQGDSSSFSSCFLYFSDLRLNCLLIHKQNIHNKSVKPIWPYVTLYLLICNPDVRMLAFTDKKNIYFPTFVYIKFAQLFESFQAEKGLLQNKHILHI